jgi:hypothetical protein
MKNTIITVILTLVLIGCTASIIYINKSNDTEINKKFETEIPTDADLLFTKNDSIENIKKIDSIK